MCWCRRAVRHALSWWLRRAAWLLDLERYLLRPQPGQPAVRASSAHSSSHCHRLAFPETLWLPMTERANGSFHCVKGAHGQGDFFELFPTFGAVQPNRWWAHLNPKEILHRLQI